VLPPTSRFGAEAAGHSEKKQRVLSRLIAYVERFFGLISKAE